MTFDIIIAVLCFPNDPTKNMTAHQMFVAEQTDRYVDLYSVSSILGKEKRVFGTEQYNYVTITAPENIENGFKVPSFIDCAKVYRVFVSPRCSLFNLVHRSISETFKERIQSRIKELQEKGKSIVYNISENEFCSWNP